MKLKPCPFCGNDNIQVAQASMTSWGIGCRPSQKHLNRADSTWNKWVDDPTAAPFCAGRVVLNLADYGWDEELITETLINVWNRRTK